MKKMGWGIVVVTAESLARVRHASLSGLFIISFIIVALIGFAGMGRLLWFTGTYASAKFGVYEARRENRGLLMKVQFLNKFIDQENSKINDLITFEDNIRLQYGLESISEDVRMAGVGGRPSPAELLLSNMLDPVLIKAESVRESLSVMLRKAELQDSTLTRVSDNVTSIHKKWSQRPSIWPTEGRITSPFGNRFHPILGQTMFHDGIDVANRVGTPVHATADGIVKFVGMRDYYGKVVMLNHSDSDCETVYAHLNQSLVSSGQFVRRGDLVGYMGNSGRSTGPHLHYEVRANGNKPINPMNYILPSDIVID